MTSTCAYVFCSVLTLKCILSIIMYIMLIDQVLFGIESILAARHAKKHDTMFDVGEMGHRDEVLPYYKLLQRIIHVIIDS